MENVVTVADLLEIKKLIYERMEIDRRLAEKVCSLVERIKAGWTLAPDVYEEISATFRALRLAQSEGKKLSEAVLEATPCRALPV